MMAKYNVVWEKLGVGHIKSLLLFSLLFCKSILKWKVYLELYTYTYRKLAGIMEWYIPLVLRPLTPLFNYILLNKDIGLSIFVSPVTSYAMPHTY